jgi:alcohol dehydrogenase (NADP+)
MVKAYAAQSAGAQLAPFQIERRAVGDHDVRIEIAYCGVCHSDVHQVRDEWGGSLFPMVPGHEIVGRVTQVGKGVQRFRVGDLAGVGCMVDSCRVCESCKRDQEQFCARGAAMTYNGTEMDRKTPTYGGYSAQVVVDERFTLKLRPGVDLAATAPLLCAGITTYSPLRHWKVKKGDRVGVVGLGGLGHMGVKLAAAMGAHVTMITTTPSKGQDARELGAHDVIISTDPAQMEAAATRFDFILNTIPVSHEIDGYLQLLGRSGRMVIVGALMQMPGFVGSNLIWWNRAVGGSAIGGIPETQEMLDFCAAESIYPDVEFIAMNQVNDAYERLLRNDVRYRFVIDMSRGL